MSRQFDEYMSDKFELNGELYQLVDPTSLKELMEALNMKYIIEQGINQGGDEQDGFYQILQEQEELIEGYIENLEPFDNTKFVKNLNYLLKSYGLRMGELESLLNISAGYISRTAKENSNKRMSIDVLWKIASLFEVDLRILLETDMNVPDNNIDIIIRFMQKLRKQTETYEVETEILGGIEYVLNKQVARTGLFKECDEGYIYYPKHLNPSCKYMLADDVVGFPHFKDNDILVIIPYYGEYKGERLGDISYDFILVSRESKWSRVFYTSDTPFYNLDDHARLLYETIRNQEFDVKLDPTIKNMISDYLS